MSHFVCRGCGHESDLFGRAAASGWRPNCRCRSSGTCRCRSPCGPAGDAGDAHRDQRPDSVPARGHHCRGRTRRAAGVDRVIRAAHSSHARLTLSVRSRRCPRVSVVRLLIPVRGRSTMLSVPFTRATLANGLDVIVHEDHRMPLVAVNVWYHVGFEERTARPDRPRALVRAPDVRGVGASARRIFRPAAGGRRRAQRLDQHRPHELLGAGARRCVAPGVVDGSRSHGLAAAGPDAGTARQPARRRPQRAPAELREQAVRARAVHADGGAVSRRRIRITGRRLASLSISAAATLDDVQGVLSPLLPSRQCVAGHCGRRRYRRGDPRGGASCSATFRAASASCRSWPPRRRSRRDAGCSWRTASSCRACTSPGRRRRCSAPMTRSLDLVSDLLANGRTSRLYSRLIHDRRIAVELAAGQTSRELGGTFQVIASAAPGHTLDELEAAIHEEIARFADEGPTRRRGGARPRPGRVGVRVPRAVARRIRRQGRSVERLQRVSPARRMRLPPDLDRYSRRRRTRCGPRRRAGLRPTARRRWPSCPRARPTAFADARRVARGGLVSDRFIQPVGRAARRHAVSAHRARRRSPTASASGRSNTTACPVAVRHRCSSRGIGRRPVDTHGLASLTGDLLDEGAGAARCDRRRRGVRAAWDRSSISTLGRMSRRCRSRGCRVRSSPGSSCWPMSCSRPRLAQRRLRARAGAAREPAAAAQPIGLDRGRPCLRLGRLRRSRLRAWRDGARRRPCGAMAVEDVRAFWAEHVRSVRRDVDRGW